MQVKNYWWPLMGDSVTYDERLVLSEFILNSSRLTYGKEIQIFESMWSQWNQSRFSIYVSSGTAANYLMILSCKHRYAWADGDEILVPAITWGTTISAIINFGLRPVFVDINPVDLSMSIEDATKKITNKTRAIFLTHVIGMPNRMTEFVSLCQERSIHLLEDCCEAHGAAWRGVKVGNFGICASYSFFWGHHMTTIEGGMLCLQDEELTEVAKSFRNHGLTRDMRNGESISRTYGLDPRFTFAMPGLHCRGTETHAKLGQIQLQKLDGFIEQRNLNYLHFAKILKKYDPKVKTLVPAHEACISSYCLPFFCDSALTRSILMELLEKEGIETRPLISGNIARHPFVINYFLDRSLPIPHLPNADLLHHQAFYVGNSQLISSENIDQMDKILTKHLKVQLN